MKHVFFISVLLVFNAAAHGKSARQIAVCDFKHTQLQTSSDRVLFNALEQSIPGWLSDNNVPSVAVTYISDNTISWTLVCGEQSPGKKATLSTLYNTASIAKPVVAEVALRLASQGYLSLDEPMSAHWIDPDIADDSHRNRLTPRIAFAHQTGFMNWRRLSDDGRLMFQWEPGTRTGYSGEGIQYVVRFLEKKLGTPFEEVAQSMLFEPLGVDSASFVQQSWFGERVAWRRLASGSWAAPDLNDEPLGAGDLWITSQDYARLVVGVMSDSGISDRMARERRSIVSDEVPRWCGPDKTPVEQCPAKMGFGVGWYLYEYDDHTLFAHNGSNNGEKTLVLFSNDKKTGFTVFTNGENGKAVISKVIRRLYSDSRFMTLEGY